MAISPSVINKIKWVMFRKTEPPSTSGILWAKPVGENFAFLAYNDGTWQDIAGTDGIVIPKLSANISAFDNDAGYLTALDLSGYPTTKELNSAIQQAIAGLATVARSGSYNDLFNKPTIPVVPTNVSAFTNDAGYLTQHQDISGKADKSEMSVVDGTGADADKTTIQLKSGTSAVVLKSHQSLAGKQDTLVSGTNIKTINNESVLGSGNISAEKPVVIEAPVNTTDATQPITALACEVGKYYRLDVAVETLAITLPAMTDTTTVRTVVIYLTGGTTPAVTISSTAPTGGTAPDVYYQDGYAIESGKTYEVNCLWNGDAWIVATVEIILT